MYVFKTSSPRSRANRRLVQDMGATDVIDVECRIAGNAGAGAVV